ncbi:hypothetical protein TSL6_21040 [Sulfurovum sp. TSL6]|nr:hypothetical protein TSL6_21040 [Sulfurovum sp. TSL6]
MFDDLLALLGLKKDTKDYYIRIKKINRTNFILFKAIFAITVNKQHKLKDTIMTNNEVTSQKENKAYEVISFTDMVAFNYTLPDNEEPQTIEHELTFIWEDTIEKFIEEHGIDKPYKVHTFKREREQKFFIERIEGQTEELIDEVEEEIANKMKFGFEFSGQLHNDD